MNKDLVLIVDEDRNTLQEIEVMVKDENFETLFCHDFKNAQIILEKRPVCVLVSNLKIQDENGIYLLNQAKDIYPSTICVALADSSRLDLQEVLSAVNYGEVFRVVIKTLQHDELITVIRKAVAYYDLCKEKKELEQSLNQRNTAYKNMLRTLEMRISEKKELVQHLKKFFMLILAGFTKEMTCGPQNGRVIIDYVTEIVDDYFKTLPTIQDGFTLGGIFSTFNKYIREHSSELDYSEKIDKPELRCFGNPFLLTMILIAVIKLLNYSHTGHRFKTSMSAEVYEQLVRLNSVIELGHVGGVDVPECSDEILLHDNLKYYISLLAHIGQPHNINVTYTYVNQNHSVITIEANIAIYDTEKSRRL